MELSAELRIIVEQLALMHARNYSSRLASVKQARFFAWKLDRALGTHAYHAHKSGLREHGRAGRRTSWVFYFSGGDVMDNRDWLRVTIDTSNYSYPRMTYDADGIAADIIK